MQKYVQRILLAHLGSFEHLHNDDDTEHSVAHLVWCTLSFYRFALPSRTSFQTLTLGRALASSWRSTSSHMEISFASCKDENVPNFTQRKRWQLRRKYRHHLLRNLRCIILYLYPVGTVTRSIQKLYGNRLDVPRKCARVTNPIQNTKNFMTSSRHANRD